MLRDIENGCINMVITKDLSRLGRDYITAGRFTELYFPAHGIRYIALNDGYDSQPEADCSSIGEDLAPFRHVINEMYARDASRKIRSALQARMCEGRYIGNFAPYGYKKDATDKNHLVIDEGPASVVQKIFQLAADGISPAAIADYLNRRAIPSPARQRQLTRLQPAVDSSSVWHTATICKMLKNQVYLGHMIQGKTRKPTFKSERSLPVAQHQWYTVLNTHEPLISNTLFNAVQKRRISRRPPPCDGFVNLFSGIACCADCNHAMSSAKTRRAGGSYNLICGSYKQHGKKSGCSSHWIPYEMLCEVVLQQLGKVLTRFYDKKACLCDAIKKQLLTKSACSSAEQSSVSARRAAIDTRIQQAFEEHTAGRLTDLAYDSLMRSYSEQYNACQTRLTQLAAQRSCNEAEAQTAACCYADALLNPQHLTRTMLTYLIKRIEIGSAEGTGRHRHQKIRIIYAFEPPEQSYCQ